MYRGLTFLSMLSKTSLYPEFREEGCLAKVWTIFAESKDASGVAFSRCWMPSSHGNERLLQDSLASLTKLSSDDPSRSVLMRDGCHRFTNDVIDSQSRDESPPLLN